MGIWEFSFLLSLLVGQIRLKFFASLSANRSFLFPIPFSVWKLYNKLPFSFSSAAYKPILFIAINLAPSIYQFWDWTVSSNNIKKCLMVFVRIMLRRGVRSDAQLSSKETRFQKCSQSGKNGSKHPMLSIFMANNVISCKKIERNTQKIKIADFTM